MKRKNPTSKEVQTVIEKLIRAVDQLELNLVNLNVMFLHYLEYKKEGPKFAEYLQKKEEENVEQENARKSPSRK